MKLYLNPISPFCRAAAIYLEERSVEHETVELTRGADRVSLLGINPSGEVPVLDTERGVIPGAQAICDFADLEYPTQSVLPADSIARAATANLEEVACSTTDALQFLVNLVSFRRPGLAEEVPDFAITLDEAVQEHFAFLDSTLAEAPFATAPFSRVDVFLFCMVSSLVFMGKSLPSSCSSLAGWFGCTSTRPSVARNLESALRSARDQANSPDPFFAADQIHWRSHRIEWACRLGLAPWLSAEIENGRVFFSSPPRSGARPTRRWSRPA